jgi:hypothetical protein
MKKIILGLTLLILFYSTKVFSLDWDKKNIGNKIEEGFFGNSVVDFPNCKKLNSLSSLTLRQGKIIQIIDGNIYNIQHGVFDCKRQLSGNLAMGLWLGIAEFPGSKNFRIVYKNDALKSYEYSYITNYGWEHVTKSVDILNQNEDPTFSRRELTVTEIVDAENLLQYFRGIDFSSKTAKKYKIIDNRLVPNN